MNRPAMAVLALALIVVPALWFVASVNRDLGHLHRRLDQHERLIATLADLLPVVRPLPPEARPPAP